MKNYKIQREEKIGCIQTFVYDVSAETEAEAFKKLDDNDYLNAELTKTEYDNSLEIVSSQIIE